MTPGTLGTGWLDPELATLTTERFSDPGWMYERKFDGERCLAYRTGGSVALMTRNALDVSATYPEVRDALVAQGSSDFVVDGEVVAFDGDSTSFGLLQQRLGIHSPAPELIALVPVVYYVFDVLSADGQDTRPLPLRERKPMLRDLLAFDDPVRYAEHRDGNGEPFWEQACARGWEGLIAKRASARYRAGRSKDWLKFKCLNSQEFVIGGFTDPQGSRTGFGALLIGYYDAAGRLLSAGRVGTGFNAATLARLHRSLTRIERDRSPFEAGMVPGSKGLSSKGLSSNVHWVEPVFVARIGFSEWTAGGQLRHPRYEGLRQDKDPRSVVREIPS